MLAALLLSDFFKSLVLEFGEVARVLEHLDKGVLVKRLLGCLFHRTDSINCGLKESLLVHVSRVDVRQVLLLVIPRLSLTLLNRCVLDGDCLTHLNLVNNDRLVGAEDVE